MIWAASQRIRRFDFWLVLAVLLAARLPFIWNGYGADPDAWRIAGAARHIAETHTYTVSRFPGYPVVEIFSAPFQSGGYVALNLLAVALSLVSAGLLWLIAGKLRTRNRTLLILIFGLTPIIYVSSVSSMDYIWALAFLLGGFWSALSGKPMLAGILLGLATGSRITSALMLAPLLVVWWPQYCRNTKLVKFFAAVLLVALLCWAPAVLRSGWGVFHYAQPSGYDWQAAIGFAAQVFGLPGSLAIAIGVLISVPAIKMIFRSPQNPTETKFALGACLAAVLVYSILYFRLPLEAGYLIPAVPFGLLLLAAFFKPRLFAITGIAIVLGAFFFGFNREGVHWQGPILQDRSERLAQLRLAQDGLLGPAYAPALVVTGNYFPVVTELAAQSAFNSQNSDDIKYSIEPAASELAAYKTQGYSIYFFPEMDSYEIDGERVSLEDYGAQSLPRR